MTTPTEQYTKFDETLNQLDTLAYEIGELISQADNALGIVEGAAERLRELNPLQKEAFK